MKSSRSRLLLVLFFVMETEYLYCHNVQKNESGELCSMPLSMDDLQQSCSYRGLVQQ